MTTLYLVRHSEPLIKDLDIYNTDETVSLTNVKTPLTINGEVLAEKISKNQEFNDLDVVWSSDYVRAIATAKYFADKNNLKINVSNKLGERKQGINSWSELPSDFEQRQFVDENYKIRDGESQKETRKRITSAINELLNTYKEKRILVVGHATSTTYLLKNWCEVNYRDYYKFNGKIFFDGKWNYCETFKLEFDDNNNLINIKNIKFK